jgi:DNA-cytosine methyltransferase
MAKKMFDFDVTLSLFDGISCGQEALKRAGLTTRIYLASEIEKYPMMITRKNHPLTVQLGDVTKIVSDNLPHINLLMGGSPCQGFSFAGKQLNFDDPRSALFFEFVRLLKECKPDYFLLENVMMKQEYQDIITNCLGVEPVMINSSLISAQNRKRLYWTNIKTTQLQDKKILLKDILEKNIKGDRSCELKTYKPNSICHHSATATDIKGNESIKRIYSDTGKSPTLTTMNGGHRQPKVLIVPEATKKGFTEIQDGDCFDATFINSKTRRGRNMKDKSNCLTAANYDYMRYEHPTYRKLTVLECSRLQTLPDTYLQNCFDKKGKPISDSQKFRALGNGWTVDVIAHIFKGIKNNA